MIIGMVLPTAFPPDIRVEKEALTLAEHHDVHVLCPRRGLQEESENWRGVHVHRVFSRLQRWLSRFAIMARCDSRIWESAIRDYATSIGADVLHVHDLPLLGPARRVASSLGIALVADLHENYPAMLEESRRVPLRRLISPGSLVARLLVSVRRWSAYEQAVVPEADEVIVVIEEACQRLERLGVDPERMHVVGNYATLDSDVPDPAADADGQSTPMSVVYAGGFDSTRDLETVLRAVAILPPDYRSAIKVQLVGGQGRDLAQLEDLAAELGIDENVELLRWLPRIEAERLMSNADVGLVPHVKSAHTDATIPHKIFQYMWRRLPVIVSDCAPLERIVKSSECGFVYRSGDRESLAQCLIDAFDTQDRRETLGEAGRRAVAQTYNWPNAGATLLRIYESLT